ncbi:MAG: hypothetical protein IJP27_04230, partial [Clostridia bacterium]|nr:hypothetical protein [Clostridia bacterium]
EEQVMAADEFAMTPMMEMGHLQESLSEMDFTSLQGGALYLVTSMPADAVLECMEPYLRGVNCEVQYLVIRPEEEPERGPNMKVLSLGEMEDE